MVALGWILVGLGIAGVIGAVLLALAGAAFRSGEGDNKL